MILHLESFIAPKQVDSMYFDLGLDSSNKMAVAVAGSFCTIQPSTFPFYYIIILYFQSVALCYKPITQYYINSRLKLGKNKSYHQIGQTFYRRVDL